MGLRRIEEKLQREAALREKGTRLALQELEQMITDLRGMHKQLQDLEKKFGKDLKKNPQAAQQLMQLRAELGLPQEVGVFERKSSPGLMDKLTGGGFYEQLAMHVLNLGREAIPETGGVMSFPELIRRVQDLYQGHVVAISDITKAVEVLEKNQLIAGVEELDTGFRLVRFISQEMSPDMETVLRVANKHNGEVSKEQLILETGWSLDRVDRALKQMEEQQMVIKDESFEGVRYYFAGV